MGDQMYMRCGVWCWRREWSAAEEDRLKRAFEAGANDDEIGRRLRRSAFSIRRKRLTLDLRRNRGSQPWPPERLARAQRLRAAGLSSSAIARELGHKVTRNMVIGALWRAAA
jgi:DNA-binding CsgD family transcriptional regulator